MAESLQHKLDRVRRPRVHITYDVETHGAMEKKELPFVVGIMADLSGAPKDPLKPLKDRKFVYVDRDNINDVLAASAPRVAFRVQNKLTSEDTKLGVELNFKSMDDFSPAKIAEQVPALKELLDMRERLKFIEAKVIGSDKVEQLLTDVLSSTEEKLKERVKEASANGEAPPQKG